MGLLQKRRIPRPKYTPHNTKRMCPSQLLMNRIIRTKVPVFILSPTGQAHKEARQADRKQKEKQKNDADKHRRARVMEHKVGDKILLRQTKTTVKPPYDTEAYMVEQIRALRLQPGGERRK